MVNVADLPGAAPLALLSSCSSAHGAFLPGSAGDYVLCLQWMADCSVNSPKVSWEVRFVRHIHSNLGRNYGGNFFLSAHVRACVCD